eukprot:TRINITY_DN54593_c0_g1_i1.p1 TRINITY_DN54593_c0_g1~~TRINITY_DN54593_c0_g1_i1.p1  ORF type:complete len:574 (+),score=90.99 TRINITY_DN54593_c0_g1_i1:197-1918(+)
MFQAATAFTGGVWVRGKLNDIQLPQFRRAVAEADSFKLSVRILSASIPSLSAPGLLKRERPRVEVKLGNTRKITEPGDFAQDRSGSSSFPSILKENGEIGSNDTCPPCPWQFGDTLTFAAQVSDVAGQGLCIWLRSASEVRLGPVQVDLAAGRELAACSVDLRHRVLPACVRRRTCDVDSFASQVFVPGSGCGPCAPSSNISAQSVWESPVLVLPLAHVSELPGAVGQAAAHVTVVFNVNSDPKALLSAADVAARPLADKVVGPLRRLVQEPVRWVVATGAMNTCGASPTGISHVDCSPHGEVLTSVGRHWSIPGSPPATNRRHSHGGSTSSMALNVEDAPTPSAPSAALARFSMSKGKDDASRDFRSGGDFHSPEMSPEGWVSHEGPSGRIFWHHLSLGPPPWERRSPANGRGEKNEVHRFVSSPAADKSTQKSFSAATSTRPTPRDGISSGYQPHEEPPPSDFGKDSFVQAPEPSSGVGHSAGPPAVQRFFSAAMPTPTAQVPLSYRGGYTRGTDGFVVPATLAAPLAEVPPANPPPYIGPPISMTSASTVMQPRTDFLAPTISSPHSFVS